MTRPNQFTVVGDISREQVVAGLHVAPLLRRPETFPFAGANISFEWMTRDDVLPTSLVSVQRKVTRQGVISEAMNEQRGFDQYELEYGGVLLDGGPEGRQGVIPPIVVDTKSGPEGVTMPGILDGMHRAVNCFFVQKRRRMLVAYITGVAVDWRPYAYHNPWSDVRIMEEKPEDKTQWKYYVGDPLKDEEYDLFVDFSRLNGSKPYVLGEGTEGQASQA